MYFDAIGGWDPKLKGVLLPPLPVSQLVIAVFAVVFIKSLVRNMFVLLVLFVVAINLIVSLFFYGTVNYRYLVISIELLSLVTSYIVLYHANVTYWNKLSANYKYNVIVKVTIFIGLLCIVTDVYFGLKPFNFITSSFAIYNFWDYFSVLFGGVFVYAFIYRKLNKKSGIIYSVILFILFYYFATLTQSRGVLYSVYVTLFFIVLVNAVESVYSKNIPYRYIFSLMMFISVMYLVAAYFNVFLNVDDSLQDRARMVIGLFDSINIYSLFFPITSSFRMLVSDGSLHNELLEIFSNFGVVGTVVVYVFLFRIINNKYNNYQSSILAICVIFMSLSQLNLYHLYSANLLMLIIVVHLLTPNFSRSNKYYV